MDKEEVKEVEEREVEKLEEEVKEVKEVEEVEEEITPVAERWEPSPDELWPLPPEGVPEVDSESDLALEAIKKQRREV